MGLVPCVVTCLICVCVACAWRVRGVQQKLEEARHRATQEQYYGKRGMSYHGTGVFISRLASSVACAVQHLVPDASSHPYQTYFFDDIVRNSQQQDTVAAMSLLEAAAMRVKAMFPEAETVSFQSDNGAAYASPFLLTMLPVIAAKHGLRATEYIHSEAGDGKTVLDGHFGIQTFMMKVRARARACALFSSLTALPCSLGSLTAAWAAGVPLPLPGPQAFVDRGGDMTTPEQVVEALLSNPLRNTMVCLVSFDVARLAALAKVTPSASVTGSAAIRHAVFCGEGMRVGRHAQVAPTALIPQAYIDRVIADVVVGLDARATVTGVEFEGQDKPAVVSLSRTWKPQRVGTGAHEGASPALPDEPSLPFSVIQCSVGELLRCNLCDRLFVSVHGYVAHGCPGVATPRPSSVLARGSAMALDRAPYCAPHPIVTLPAAAATNAAKATCFVRGWARPVARDKEHLDATAVRLITQWFEEGQGGKTKCSAATALQRLRALRDDAGLLVYADDDALPSEARIKRFFGSLSQKRRAAA